MTDRRRIARADVPTTGGRKYDVVIEGEEGGGQRLTARIQGHMPHDRYRDKGWITGAQHQAANAMHKDYVLGKLETLRAQDWHKVDRGYEDKYLSTPMGACTARDRFLKALEQLEPIGAGIVLHVCGEGETAPEAGRRYGKGARYSMERLRDALQVIAVFKNLA